MADWTSHLTEWASIRLNGVSFILSSNVEAKLRFKHPFDRITLPFARMYPIRPNRASFASSKIFPSSVLLSMHCYWSSIFILPKQVIEGVISACRNFLWGGKVASHKTPLVAWDLICRKKKRRRTGAEREPCLEFSVAR